MKKKDVIQYFGGVSATADFLKIKPASVSQWPDPIPKGRAYELEKLTKGKLRFDEKLYQKPKAAA